MIRVMVVDDHPVVRTGLVALLEAADDIDLLAAVRSVADGETTLALRVASRLVERVRGGTVDALSPHEIEVLEHVAEGSSNAEMAAALHVSEATVKTHLLHVFDKLGVRTRTAAVTRAAQLGIIGLGGEADRTGP